MLDALLTPPDYTLYLSNSLIASFNESFVYIWGYIIARISSCLTFRIFLLYCCCNCPEYKLAINNDVFTMPFGITPEDSAILVGRLLLLLLYGLMLLLLLLLLLV